MLRKGSTRKNRVIDAYSALYNKARGKFKRISLLPSRDCSGPDASEKGSEISRDGYPRACCPLSAAVRYSGGATFLIVDSYRREILPLSPSGPRNRAFTLRSEDYPAAGTRTQNQRILKKLASGYSEGFFSGSHTPGRYVPKRRSHKSTEIPKLCRTILCLWCK
jgi:hypothetical protein